MPDRGKAISDGVPREILDEITDRLGSLVDKGWESPAQSDNDLARVLASFEEQLMRLNRELRNGASGRMKAVREECEETRELVSDLNADLDGVVKENIR